jgi:LytS/YehU family sensor histidine kinase
MAQPVGNAQEKILGDLLHRREFWFSCVLGLHVLILVHALQWYLYALFAGKTPHTLLYLRWSLSLWYTRAIMALPCLWIAMRYRFQLDRWFRYFVIYTVSGIVLGVASSALQSVVVTRIETGKVFAANNAESPSIPDNVHLTRFQEAIVKGWPKLVYNMFTCWMMIVLVQGVIYSEDARKRRMQSLELETQLATVNLRALRMQLNPHFLFNTLHAISTLIEEEPQVAEEMVLRLSHLLRSILDEDQPEIPLRKELCFLEDHLAIERVRFGDRLTARIAIDDSLLDCAVPQLILQPLVENVIRHGIGRHAGCDSIDISAKENNGLLHIEVRNINSLLDSPAERPGRVGIGLSNTNLRLKTLYQEHSSLELRGLSPSGVAVVVTLPLRRMENVVHEPQEVGVR